MEGMVLGAKINELALGQDEDGDTMLHISVVQSNVKICHHLTRLVAQEGRNVDIYNKMLQTPLHLACITDQIKVIKQLLENGLAQVSVKDRHGNTALHLCVIYGRDETLHLILEFLRKTKKLSLTIDLCNYEGSTALHLAASLDKSGHVALLLAYSAAIDVQDFKSGKTPLYLAVQAVNITAAKLLLEAGADPNSMTHFRDSPSQLASNIDDRSFYRLISRFSPNNENSSRSPPPKLGIPSILAIDKRESNFQPSCTSIYIHDEFDLKPVKDGVLDMETPNIISPFVKLKLKRQTNLNARNSSERFKENAKSNDEIVPTTKCTTSQVDLTKIGETHTITTASNISINRNCTTGYFNGVCETPLDLSMRPIKQHSVSHMRTVCKKKYAVCETSLNRTNVTNIENETSLHSQCESTPKNIGTNKHLENDFVNTPVRMSIKQERDVITEKGRKSTNFPSSEINLESSSEASMSTLLHSEGMGVVQNPSFNAHVKEPNTAQEYNTTSATFFAPNGLPLEYYSPFLHSTILKSGLSAVPYTWTNIALAHAMKTLKYEQTNKDTETTLAAIYNKTTEFTSTGNRNDKSTHSEYRSKLHCSLSDDSDRTNRQTGIERNTKKFERRNSAPLQSSVIEQNDKSISPPDLHSYTGCLPPHFLHLLQSSGNLPIVRTEAALAHINGLYIDPRSLHHGPRKQQDKCHKESPATLSNLNTNFQYKLPIHNTAFTNVLAGASENGFPSSDLVVDTSDETNDISSSHLHSIAEPTDANDKIHSSNKTDNPESDDENMESIQISEDEVEDNFEDILQKTATDQLAMMASTQSLSLNHYLKQTKSWQYIDALPVFNTDYSKPRTSKTFHKIRLPSAKSGYQINQTIPTTRVETIPKIKKKNTKKKTPTIKISSKCHYTTVESHSCEGCVPKKKISSLTPDSTLLMFDILRHGGVNRKSYSSTKAETSVVFCSETEKSNLLLKEEEYTRKNTKNDSSKPCDVPVSYTHKLFNRSRKPPNKTESVIKLVSQEAHTGEETTKIIGNMESVTEQTHDENSNKVQNKRGSDVVSKENRKRSPPPYSINRANKISKNSVSGSTQPATIPYATAVNYSNATHRYIFPSAISRDKLFQEAYFPLHTLGLSPLLFGGLKMNAKLSQVNPLHAATLRSYQQAKRQRLTTEDEKLEITDLEISDDDS